MTITIELPPGVDVVSSQLEREARETVGVRLYRQEMLSHGQLAKYLGIPRGEVDSLLKKYGVNDEFTAEEIAEQADAMRAARDQQTGS